ncbi:phosphotransferase [uncultured Williamsia sp.]|uniref:phosphotransferase family protein n=1 Tax=uncultured Williamsia sp. TaxID=259311 RepID=UPI002623F1D4|nr:phosphotransferase [uncultured Williamsia sp.]
MPGWWSLDDIDATWVRDVLGIADARGWELDRVTRGRITQASRLLVRRSDGRTEKVLVKCVDPGWSGPVTPVEREHRLYAGVADLSLPVATCRANRLDIDSRVFWLVLEDVGPADYGDDLAGPTFSTTFLTMAALATIHRAVGPQGPRPDWVDPLHVPDRTGLGDDYVRFVERYGERIDPVHLSLANQVVSSIGTLTDHAARLGAQAGLVHGDFRFGNLVLGRHGSGHALVVTNWSHVSWGPRVVDLASFLAMSLSPEIRRRNYDELLHRYLAALGGPVDGEALGALRREIHDHAFLVLVQVIRCAVETPGWEARQRSAGDLWLTLFARVCTFLDDLGRPLAAPAPGRPARPVALADEFAHPGSVGDGRSEEWTLAVTDVDAGLGVWVRFGRHAALDSGAYVAVSVSGPDLPTVTLSTLTADLDESLSVTTDGVRMQHTVVDPLRHVHLRLTGRGDADGSDVGIVLDVHWYTSADPALYGVTPLLLIPSVATGTITLTGLGDVDRRIAVDAPGYREHAWAGTDWWDMRWTAFVAHFDDDSEMNGIDIRVPGLDPMSLGHLQSATSTPTLIDVARVISRPDGPDRLGSWAFAVEPGAHTVTFTPTAVADVLRPGGPHAIDEVICRTWGIFTRNDGRRGVGWVETKAVPVTSGPATRGLHDPTGPGPNL